MKTMYYVTGIATKADKTRDVQIGQLDTHAIPAINEQEALSMTSLENPIVTESHPLNKYWV